MAAMTSIRPASWPEYRDSRAHRFSRDALRFDDPDRPLPSCSEEEQWWQREVVSGHYICQAIEDSAGRLVGFICAFCLDPVTHEAETGIVIFPEENQRRGHARRAYSLFMDDLQQRFGLERIWAETNALNQPARALFAQLGFTEESRQTEGQVEWLVLVRHLVPSLAAPTPPTPGVSS